MNNPFFYPANLKKIKKDPLGKKTNYSYYLRLFGIFRLFELFRLFPMFKGFLEGKENE